ncbi:acetoin utilization protein AcuC [Mangrovactinospora gilvigrisea]|uniref:Acetoin utilization protein AcuC n=1 Tax=Mangrovactinospora gilvigrisea TaxID=1428644 RepID=A0A1J7BF66_9ACTN|nr:acetoin utilization protein AcuC [Mangrovactinospora gilvigrisea]OIV37286.1 acetoin utilization protein AcuC [Mangrovactinospora gilvigrisea]
MGEDACNAVLMWDDAVTEYDFGDGHPMNPLRLRLTMDLIDALHVPVDVRAAPPAADATLRLVHTDAYLDAVKAAAPAPEFGIGTDDNWAFPAMHRASALITGQSAAAAEAVRSGEATHAVNIAGGLHHAMAAKASGFCVYNDPAVAIAVLLERGVSRVAYVDCDVHHGDGVQAAFWNDPRVLTISLHEHPAMLFPQTGWPEETGGPDAQGTAVNLALPPGTRDRDWLRAFHAVVPELLAEWQPEVLVTQHGADTHLDDPLAHLMLTVDGQRAAAAACHDLAHRHAGGRWVALGGGGYDVVGTVPRAWTHLTAEAAGHPLAADTSVPPEWRLEARRLSGEEAPFTMGEGGDTAYLDFHEDGFDPASRLDQAIIAVRRAVWPHHGMLP